MFRKRYLVPEGRLSQFSTVSAVLPRMEEIRAGTNHGCDLFPGLRTAIAPVKTSTPHYNLI